MAKFEFQIKENQELEHSSAPVYFKGMKDGLKIISNDFFGRDIEVQWEIKIRGWLLNSTRTGETILSDVTSDGVLYKGTATLDVSSALDQCTFIIKKVRSIKRTYNSRTGEMDGPIEYAEF